MNSMAQTTSEISEWSLSRLFYAVDDQESKHIPSGELLIRAVAFSSSALMKALSRSMTPQPSKVNVRFAEGNAKLNSTRAVEAPGHGPHERAIGN